MAHYEVHRQDFRKAYGGFYKECTGDFFVYSSDSFENAMKVAQEYIGYDNDTSSNFFVVRFDDNNEPEETIYEYINFVESKRPDASREAFEKLDVPTWNCLVL